MKHLTHLLTTGALSAVLASGAAAVDPWTGGVGEGARDTAPERNTRVEFFVDNGAYLADIDYELYSADGDSMADGQADGPWVLMELSPGEYSIRGTRESTGEVQSTRFQVEENREQVIGLTFGEG